MFSADVVLPVPPLGLTMAITLLISWERLLESPRRNRRTVRFPRIYPHEWTAVHCAGTLDSTPCPRNPNLPGRRLVRIRRLIPYLRRHRKALAIGVFAIVVGDLLLLASPWWLRKAIDALNAGDMAASRDAALVM